MNRNWPWTYWFLLFIGVLTVVRSPFVMANEKRVNDRMRDVCAGMYSRDDRGGKVDPHIAFDLQKLYPTQHDYEPGVIVVIFDFEDYQHIGVELPDGSTQYICDEYSISKGLCKEHQLNHFIIQDVIYDPFSDSTKGLANEVLTFSHNYLGSHDSVYPVMKTGYYCVRTATVSSSIRFDAAINFRNAFGRIDAAEVDNIRLYGWLSLGYMVTMAMYFYPLWKNRDDLLPLHRYIMIFFAFLTIETISIWIYYLLKNEKGNTIPIKVYMVFISLMSAGKATFTYFFLLIIALGYGIVYARLNRTLVNRCRAFSIVNFFLYSAYLIQSYAQNPESTSTSILITAVPTVLLMFVFFFLILRAITNTTAYLKSQKQTYKLAVYNRLLIVIYATLTCIFIGLILCAFAYLGMNAIEIIEKHWMVRFYLTDFWPSLVYFFAFISFAYIWRPTGTTFMLTTAQQLPEELENVIDVEMDDLDVLSEEFNMDDYVNADEVDTEHQGPHSNDRERADIDDIFADDNINYESDVFSDSNAVQENDTFSLNSVTEDANEESRLNGSRESVSPDTVINTKTRS
ncbi:putative membrane protein [Nakaseomyces bracarensis]|uniref:Membrane protein n=1 Tax=Nakaseomyces bracarensis TaxID=273131 RepID=A0ABR4NN42_9SACH